MSESLHPKCVELLEQQQRERMNIERLSHPMFVVDTVAAECEVKINISAYTFSETLDCHIEIHHHKDIVPVLKAFAKRGWRQTRPMVTRNNGYGWSWCLVNEKGRLNLAATPAGSTEEVDGKVCRRVKVGTKTVETDVYEIICDGDE